jgi:hypothetical protein
VILDIYEYKLAAYALMHYTSVLITMSITRFVGTGSFLIRQSNDYTMSPIKKANVYFSSLMIKVPEHVYVLG